MSGVLRHWQMPEWSARALWDFAYSVLSKTYEYNPSADDWRILRPEDIVGGTAGLWLNPRAVLATVPGAVVPGYQDLTPVVGGMRIPQGVGIGFYGFWIQGPDLGLGAGYQLLVNFVKRIECPIHEFMADSKGANKLLASAATGFIFWFHVHYIHLEQLVFCRENDVVQYMLKGQNAQLANSFEFFPLAVIAGHSKQLLTNA